MKDSIFLIVNAKGIVRTAKGVRRPSYGPRQRPRLGAGEYAVLLSVTVPDTVFKPIAIPEATLTVPESAVIVPTVAVEIEDAHGHA